MGSRVPRRGRGSNRGMEVGDYSDMEEDGGEIKKCKAATTSQGEMQRRIYARSRHGLAVPAGFKSRQSRTTRRAKAGPRYGAPDPWWCTPCPERGPITRSGLVSRLSAHSAASGPRGDAEEVGGTRPRHSHSRELTKRRCSSLQKPTRHHALAQQTSRVDGLR